MTAESEEINKSGSNEEYEEHRSRHRHDSHRKERKSRRHHDHSELGLSEEGQQSEDASVGRKSYSKHRKSKHRDEISSDTCDFEDSSDGKSRKHKCKRHHHKHHHHDDDSDDEDTTGATQRDSALKVIETTLEKLDGKDLSKENEDFAGVAAETASTAPPQAASTKSTQRTNSSSRTHFRSPSVSSLPGAVHQSILAVPAGNNSYPRNRAATQMPSGTEQLVAQQRAERQSHIGMPRKSTW